MATRGDERRHFKPRRRLEQQYANEMIDFMFERILPTLSQSRSVSLMSSMHPFLPAEALDEIATRIARRMVTGVGVQNARSWQQAAARSMQAKKLYGILQTELSGRTGAIVARLVAENAKLIQSLPADVAKSTAAYIARQQQRGSRPEQIAKELHARLPEITRTKARLIARTETAKAETAFTEARSQNLGLRWYRWATSEDGRVRRSHRHLDRVVIAWAEAPAPEALVGERSKLGSYPPGGCPNCRCLALPLILLDEISWPAQVFTGGAIRRMTREQFAVMAGYRQLPRRRAA